MSRRMSSLRFPQIKVFVEESTLRLLKIARLCRSWHLVNLSSQFLIFVIIKDWLLSNNMFLFCHRSWQRNQICCCGRKVQGAADAWHKGHRDIHNWVAEECSELYTGLSLSILATIYYRLMLLLSLWLKLILFGSCWFWLWIS